MFDNIRAWYHQLPDKKKYVEFVSAILSVPVLVTVILINLNNLTQKNAAKQADQIPSPAITKIVETLQPINIMQSQPAVSSSPSATPAPTGTPAECLKQVGPVTIVNPHENEVVTSGSVCIKLDYQQGNYCGIVWSYSLDSSAWSDYSNSTMCLYNLATGGHVLQVRVKSAVAENQVILQRTFTYGAAAPSLSPTQSASSAAQ